ncbi:2-C-methyl-D-erythritol 2,4-cyclodiphosphate synthase [Alicyclobacillaceae bacterium I2511]|nr:2-C-methyl-D-erythritol 2,4-cyclodiphosphate synthase [Alicyclobacillaceae bacterium I2511]
MRVGLGFDVHPFEDNRPLRLAGVDIPFPRGLKGHSDADVVLHAVVDALLGALALGDIGEHFPDTDPRYHNADSLLFVKTAWDLVCQQGFVLANLDVMVLAEQPRLSPYKQQMRLVLAEVLEAKLDTISLKATTTEGLGFVGRVEGIAAQAVVLLEKGRNH